VQEGVTLNRFNQLHDQALIDVFSAELEQLTKQELLTIDEQRVRLTQRGLMLGNQVFCYFLPD
jgi:oxygen-independent coproporphyrinogen-3 oxidase